MSTPPELPKSMKAAVVDKPGPPSAIHLKDVPLPAVPPDHVLIALEFAGNEVRGIRDYRYVPYLVNELVFEGE